MLGRVGIRGRGCELALGGLGSAETRAATSAVLVAGLVGEPARWARGGQRGAALGTEAATLAILVLAPQALRAHRRYVLSSFRRTASTISSPWLAFVEYSTRQSRPTPDPVDLLLSLDLVIAARPGVRLEIEDRLDHGKEGGVVVDVEELLLRPTAIRSLTQPGPSSSGPGEPRCLGWARRRSGPDAGSGPRRGPDRPGEQARGRRPRRTS